MLLGLNIVLSACCPCRNAIVLSPHVRAAKCSIAAASIVREAAERAGAPPGLIQWIDKPSLALATALMKDPKINLILATGGSAACIALHGGLVKQLPATSSRSQQECESVCSSLG